MWGLITLVWISFRLSETRPARSLTNPLPTRLAHLPHSAIPQPLIGGGRDTDARDIKPRRFRSYALVCASAYQYLDQHLTDHVHNTTLCSMCHHEVYASYFNDAPKLITHDMNMEQRR